ncbi:MAG: hypothetical protein NT098_04395 [Candidatus Parcubacteria bacterium]|nr:hypothetical protein [Candidatus Parcubacteria bacterium]
MKKVLILILLVLVFVSSSSLLFRHLRGQMLVESADQTAKMHQILPDTSIPGKHI